MCTRVYVRAPVEAAESLSLELQVIVSRPMQCWELNLCRSSKCSNHWATSLPPHVFPIKIKPTKEKKLTGRWSTDNPVKGDCSWLLCMGGA